jgi:hypothetical protein
MLSLLPPTIVFNMGRRLPDEVVHRIMLRIEANEDVASIADAVKVSKKTIYKLQLNIDPNPNEYLQPRQPCRPKLGPPTTT